MGRIKSVQRATLSARQKPAQSDGVNFTEYMDELAKRLTTSRWRTCNRKAREPRGNTEWPERVIGTLRRECLDHVVVLGERHLRRIVRRYVRYYHGARTHLALGKDAPEPRSVQPPEEGRVIEISEVGGLHHRYERRAA